MPNEELKDLVITALEDRKGQDIQCLDVSKKTDITDYMILVTGATNRQVRSLTDNVIQQAAAVGIKPLGIEGQEERDWVLIDLTDVIVHIMLPATRDFYDLERLWGMTDLPGEGAGRDQ